MTSEFPFSPPGSSVAPSAKDGERASAAGSVLSSAGIVLGSAVLGLLGGLLWAQLAPRAIYEVVGRGSANVVNPETTAFIAGDAVYCLFGLLGGVIIGLVGYLLAVRRYGPWPMASILVGSVLAAGIARWVGEHSGLTAFDSSLLNSPVGTHLHAPLGLAGDTAATTWPALAAFPAMASWLLAATVVAGGLTLLAGLRERSRNAVYAEVVTPAPQRTASPIWAPPAWNPPPGQSPPQPPPGQSPSGQSPWGQSPWGQSPSGQPPPGSDQPGPPPA